MSSGVNEDASEGTRTLDLERPVGEQRALFVLSVLRTDGKAGSNLSVLAVLGVGGEEHGPLDMEGPGVGIGLRDDDCTTFGARLFFNLNFCGGCLVRGFDGELWFGRRLRTMIQPCCKASVAGFGDEAITRDCMVGVCLGQVAKGWSDAPHFEQNPKFPSMEIG